MAPNLKINFTKITPLVETSRSGEMGVLWLIIIHQQQEVPAQNELALLVRQT
jgi:hypothetical protein